MGEKAAICEFYVFSLSFFQHVKRKYNYKSCLEFLESYLASYFDCSIYLFIRFEYMYLRYMRNRYIINTKVHMNQQIHEFKYILDTTYIHKYILRYTPDTSLVQLILDISNIDGESIFEPNYEQRTYLFISYI